MAAKQFQASQSLLGATLSLRSSSICEGKFPARRNVGRLGVNFALFLLTLPKSSSASSTK